MVVSFWWIAGPWIAFFAVWAIAGANTKRDVRRQSISSRLMQVGAAVAGALLLFSRTPALSLGSRLWPDRAVIAYAGVALTFAGVLFAMWARLTLGRNWSARVTLKEDHELIRSGPYALSRHPIYTGMLLALIGGGVYVGELRAVFALVFFVAYFWMKLSTEEWFMLQQFGNQYREYQREVKALIPFVV
jgi:protein-S-isoprenylcysteine O-methyltransferase Ste14